MEIPDMSKLKRAGADSVISPTLIGGMRMASEVIRPAVNDFLDRMLRDKDRTLRFDEVEIPEKSRAVGQTLGDLDVNRKTGHVVLAVRHGGSDQFQFAPDENTEIKGGMFLVILGNADRLPQLRELVS